MNTSGDDWQMSAVGNFTIHLMYHFTYGVNYLLVNYLQISQINHICSTISSKSLLGHSSEDIIIPNVLLIYSH